MVRTTRRRFQSHQPTEVYANGVTYMPWVEFVDCTHAKIVDQDKRVRGGWGSRTVVVMERCLGLDGMVSSRRRP